MKTKSCTTLPAMAVALAVCCAGVGTALALDAGKPGAAASAAETWYVQTRVTTEFGIVTTHYWSKGPRFRADTILAGHPVTTIVNGPRYYVYDGIAGKGAAIERHSRSVAEDETRGRPFGRELDDLIATGGEKVEDGSLGDGDVGYEVYQLTNANGRRRVLVTLSDPPLPFRIETFVRKSGSRGTLEYAGWQRGLDLVDSFFDPPASIEFENIGYEEYTRRVGKEPVGPAPVYYRDLLHGKRPQGD